MSDIHDLRLARVLAVRDQALAAGDLNLARECENQAAAYGWQPEAELDPLAVPLESTVGTLERAVPAPPKRGPGRPRKNPLPAA